MTDKNPEILAIGEGSESIASLATGLAPDYDVRIDAVAADHLPDLVLLDLSGPGANGREALRRYRLAPGLESVPVVVIAAPSAAADALGELAGRTADCVTRPEDVEVVRQRLANVLRLARLEKDVKEGEDRLRFVMDASEDGIWDWHVPSGVVTHNAAWRRLLGLDGNEPQHAREAFEQRLHPEDLPAFRQAFDRCLSEGGAYLLEYRVRHARGHYLWVADRGRLVERQADGTPRRVVGCLKSVEERRRADEDIYRHAYFDLLTGLPNRRLFFDRLQRATARNERNGHLGALMLIDVDGFRKFNDTYGHAMGDVLLIEVGSRLQECLRLQDTVAHLGGDEFAFVLEGLAEQAETAASSAVLVGNRVLRMFERPFGLGTITYECSASIGMTLFAGVEDSTDHILKRADLAMHEAKAVHGSALKIVCQPAGPLSLESPAETE